MNDKYPMIITLKIVQVMLKAAVTVRGKKRHVCSAAMMIILSVFVCLRGDLYPLPVGNKHKVQVKR